MARGPSGMLPAPFDRAMPQPLCILPATTPLCGLHRSRDSLGDVVHELVWRTEVPPERWGSCQARLSIDALTPHGERGLFGVVSFTLLEERRPVGWLAMLLPLMRARSMPQDERMATPEEIRANREFFTRATERDSTLTVKLQSGEHESLFEVQPTAWDHGREAELAELMSFLASKRAEVRETDFVRSITATLAGLARWVGEREGRSSWYEAEFARSTGERARAVSAPVPRFVRQRVESGRMIDRNVTERAWRNLPERSHVFLSHFHGDATAADTIERALQATFGGCRVQRSGATAETQHRLERDSEELQRALRSSRCILFLATPGSLGRCFARHELGNNALRPLFTILLGVTVEEFEAYRARELHIAFDADRVYDAESASDWKRLLGDFAVFLDRPETTVFVELPGLTPGSTGKRSAEDEGDGFTDWTAD